MRIKLVGVDNVSGETVEAFNAYARTRVTALVTQLGKDTLDDWPTTVEGLADLVDQAHKDGPVPEGLADRLAGMSDDSTSVLAALAAMSGRMVGMTVMDMLTAHDDAGDILSGNVVGAFMKHSALTPLEKRTLAALIAVLPAASRASIGSMAAAFLAVFDITSADVMAWLPTVPEEPKADDTAGIVNGCTCDYCTEARARNAAPQTD